MVTSTIAMLYTPFICSLVIISNRAKISYFYVYGA
jgi:hypothetical protein